MNLKVYIEINGVYKHVGDINGESEKDASFQYSQSYIETNSLPISLSMPFQSEPFSSEKTKAFFEGLLPEGFTRKTVARYLRSDEKDYLHILSVLGRECLGAIKIVNEMDSVDETCAYEKLSIKQVKALAREGASKSAEFIAKSHLSLTGASGKVGLYYNNKNDSWYLPKGNASSTHIVKQSHIRMNGIVTNEQLCMLTAKKLGIDVVDSFIVNVGDFTDSEILFATSRYDRKFSDECNVVSKMKMPLRLHQEDFAQAMGIDAENKYEEPPANYLAQMMKLLRNYSENPIRDQLKLWDAIVFDYLIGNTDCHIKNFSLLYSQDMKTLCLAPIYDIVSTVIYENTSRDMAINIGGEYSLDRIDKESFKLAAKDIGIGTSIALEHFDFMQENIKKALNESAKELEALGYKEAINIKKKIIRIKEKKE